MSAEDLEDTENEELAVLSAYAKPLAIDDAGALIDTGGEHLTAGWALSNDMRMLLNYAANLSTQGWDENGMLRALHQRGINPPIALTAARQLQAFARRVVSRSRATPSKVPGEAQSSGEGAPTPHERSGE